MRPSRISYRHLRSSERGERERENGSLTGVGRNTQNARISREKSRQMLKFARRKQEGQRRRPRSLSFKRSGGETLIAASNITGEVRTWAPFHSALHLREAERRREEGARLLIVEARVKEITLFTFVSVRGFLQGRKWRLSEAIQLPLPPELFSWKDSIFWQTSRRFVMFFYNLGPFPAKRTIFDRLQK